MNQESASPATQAYDARSSISRDSVVTTKVYKNPWLTISRPMNHFMDIQPEIWEKQEILKK